MKKYVPRSGPRPTSIWAYNYLVAQGHLEECQSEVYDIVWHHGPGTAAEVWTRAGLDWNQSKTRSRFTELRDLGLFQECGKKPCEITGIAKIVYEVTELIMPLDLEAQREAMEAAVNRALQRFARRGGTADDAHRVVVKFYESNAVQKQKGRVKVRA